MTRRFQFSLRAMLVVLTVACLWLGWQVQRARTQRQAVEAIEAIGGIAQYDWQGDVQSWERIGGFRLAPSFAGRGSSDALRRALGEHLFQKVTSVVFCGGRVNYRGTGPLAALSPAWHSRYTNSDDPELEFARDIEAAIPFLRKLPHLRAIYLQGRRPGPSVSYEAEEELKTALPHCRIVREEIGIATPEPPGQ